MTWKEIIVATFLICLCVASLGAPSEKKATGTSTPDAGTTHTEHCWHSSSFQHAVANHNDQTCCLCSESRCTSTADVMESYCAQHGRHAPGCELYGGSGGTIDAGDALTLDIGSSIYIGVESSSFITLQQQLDWQETYTFMCRDSNKSITVTCDAGVVTFGVPQ